MNDTIRKSLEGVAFLASTNTVNASKSRVKSTAKKKKGSKPKVSTKIRKAPVTAAPAKVIPTPAAKPVQAAKSAPASTISTPPVKAVPPLAAKPEPVRAAKHVPTSPLPNWEASKVQHARKAKSQPVNKDWPDFQTTWCNANVCVPYPAGMHHTTYGGRPCLEGVETVGATAIQIRIFGDIDHVDLDHAGSAIGRVTINQSSDGTHCERSISIERKAFSAVIASTLIVSIGTVGGRAAGDCVYAIEFEDGVIEVCGRMRVHVEPKMLASMASAAECGEKIAA